MGDVHFLFPPDGSEPRGGTVFVEFIGPSWSVYHRNPMGGRRTLYRTIWTNEALDFAAREAARRGARGIWLQDLYK